jgi:polyhydroxyalkanoate synthase
MQNLNTNPMKEMVQATSRLIKGFETLNNIGEVEVGTTPKSMVYHLDKLKLFRYDRETPPTVKTPVLIVYALVNRFEMLDLQPDRSYIRNLLNLGLDVYVIDWGYPTRADRYNDLDDYVNGYINACVDFIRHEHHIKSINLMAICQGGTLSTIYAALHPGKVKNLITLVTPIDFSGNDGLLFRWAKDMDFDAIVDGNGGLIPGEFLNVGFELLKPMMKFNKYNGMMQMLDDADKLSNFLRMEKWIADSPDQAGECFRQFMKELYQDNKLVKGKLRIGNKVVDLKNITMPLLNVYATDDHLVPPSATIPLNDHVGSKDKELYMFQGGHIGVFVGGKSQKELAPAVAGWLKKRD